MRCMNDLHRVDEPNFVLMIVATHAVGVELTDELKMDLCLNRRQSIPQVSKKYYDCQFR